MVCELRMDKKMLKEEFGIPQRTIRALLGTLIKLEKLI